MSHLIRIVLLLGKTGNLFRGHDESVSSNQKDFYKKNDLLAMDDVLKIYLLSGAKNIQ